MSGYPSSTADVWREYEYTTRLEQELVRQRWVVFTALLSVSFVVAGLTLSQLKAQPLLGTAGFIFAYLIFCAGVYHYWWFHQKAHDLRDRLLELEDILGIQPYHIRAQRPKLREIPLYYKWAIRVLLVAYTAMLIIVLCVVAFGD